MTQNLFAGSPLPAGRSGCAGRPMELQVVTRACLEELLTCNVTTRRVVTGLDPDHLPPSIRMACESHLPHVV